MVKTDYPDWNWRIKVELDAKECPYLRFPGNTTECFLLGDYAKCSEKNCPLKMETTKSGSVIWESNNQIRHRKVI